MCVGEKGGMSKEGGTPGVKSIVPPLRRMETIFFPMEKGLGPKTRGGTSVWVRVHTWDTCHHSLSDKIQRRDGHLGMQQRTGS